MVNLNSPPIGGMRRAVKPNRDNRDKNFFSSFSFPTTHILNPFFLAHSATIACFPLKSKRINKTHHVKITSSNKNVLKWYFPFQQLVCTNWQLPICRLFCFPLIFFALCKVVNRYKQIVQIGMPTISFNIPSVYILLSLFFWIHTHLYILIFLFFHLIQKWYPSLIPTHKLKPPFLKSNQWDKQLNYIRQNNGSPLLRNQDFLILYFLYQ